MGTISVLTVMWITSLYKWLFFFSLHTLAFEGLMISDNSSYIAVVAIDFGTTYSGFAFAFNQKEGEGGIHMNKAWGNEQGLSTLKTSTSLLLRPDGQFDSFGFEADEKYANFFCGEDQEYMYFKRFKMTLHKSEVESLSYENLFTYVSYPNAYPAIKKNIAAFEDSDCVTFPTKPLYTNDGCIYSHNN